VRIHFSGGRFEDADIVVGGDGLRSSVRAQILPQVQPIYAGYYIWRLSRTQGSTPNGNNHAPMGRVGTWGAAGIARG
jgi:2-polyprenyl-6-methoxyphenol hydroxylase-like FAD-dependent oxidoreductase